LEDEFQFLEDQLSFGWVWQPADAI
jgi:hypothetical protein